MKMQCKDVAVVICNWNKKDYLIGCLESLMDSSYQKFDTIVVDNNSTDGAPEEVESRFGDQVLLIRSKENLGGAGGFNLGIRYALQKDYKYILLLDNDVILKSDALQHLSEYLDNHQDTAIVGSKILQMENPDKIQWLGAVIDLENVDIHRLYRSCDANDARIPEVIEVDMVPACALLIRSDVIRKIGGMDPRYFIYWDETDMCYDIKKAGYKVKVITKSVVYHARGSSERSSTFSDYYSRRNSIHFFVKHMPDNLIPSMALKLIDTTFKEFYFGTYNGRHNIVRSRSIALSDALQGIRGKARDGRIFSVAQEENKLANIVRPYHRFAVVVDNNVQFAVRVCKSVLEVVPDAVIDLVTPQNDDALDIIKELGIRILEKESYNGSMYELVIQCCSHITSAMELFSRDDISVFIDPYSNIASNQEEKNYICNADKMYNSYKEIYLDLLTTSLIELKQKILLEVR